MVWVSGCKFSWASLDLPIGRATTASHIWSKLGQLGQRAFRLSAVISSTAVCHLPDVGNRLAHSCFCSQIGWLRLFLVLQDFLQCWLPLTSWISVCTRSLGNISRPHLSALLPAHDFRSNRPQVSRFTFSNPEELHHLPLNTSPPHPASKVERLLYSPSLVVHFNQALTLLSSLPSVTITYLTRSSCPYGPATLTVSRPRFHATVSHASVYSPFSHVLYVHQ